MILITGATGKTGSEVARQLLRLNIPVRLFVRDRAKLSANLSAAEVVTGDLADSTAVDLALEGVSKAVLIVANGEQQLQLETQFTDRARAAGLQHLVYLSSMESIAGVSNAIPAMHVAVEEHIRAAGLHWTMIRPTFFMQNLLGASRTIAASNSIRLPMGSGKVAATDLRDAASVMVATLISEGEHYDQSYDLTGPDLLTMDNVASAFSRVLGKEISYVEQPLTEFSDHLSQFLPAWRVTAVCEEFAALAKSTSARTTGNVEKILGRSPTDIEQFIRDHLDVYKD